MTEPIVPVKCFKCGANCFSCSCSPCPRCDGMLCVTCEILRTDLGVRRDVPIPEHPRPKRCNGREELKESIEIVPESGRFVRAYGSDQFIGDEARRFGEAIGKIFGFAAAGVVAGACVVMLAAAAVFSGELPNDRI